MRIILLGYMYSGKTTVGRKLACRLGLDFYDIDNYFEEKFRISVQDFFLKYDEEAFRRIERQLLLELTEKDDLVLASGGGTPCFFDNMELIKRRGISVYLKMDPASILHRALHSKKKRPLFRNISRDELPDFILRHLQEREGFYMQADLVFKGEDADVKKLAELISNSF